MYAIPNSDLNSPSSLSPNSISSNESSFNVTSPGSPANGIRETVVLDLQTQLVELQRENARIKAEIEAKETKLSSSMRSIKTFWSPELKKERAARKAESEKYLQLKEQFNIVEREAQVRVVVLMHKIYRAINVFFV